jgi:hypothetical protein
VIVQESYKGELSDKGPADLVALMHKGFRAQFDVIAKAHGISMGGVQMVDELQDKLGQLYRKRLVKLRKDIEKRLKAEVPAT